MGYSGRVTEPYNLQVQASEVAALAFVPPRLLSYFVPGTSSAPLEGSELDGLPVIDEDPASELQGDVRRCRFSAVDVKNLLGAAHKFAIGHWLNARAKL